MNKIFLVLLICLILASCSPAPDAARGQVPESAKPSTPQPAAPPVSSRIVFVSDRDGNDEIYMMEADGSDPQRLTDNPALDGGPDWSNDGQRILFHTARGGDTEIYVMDQNGANPVNLTNSPGDDTYPAWSPDMQKIAFESKRDGNIEIYIMDAGGGNQTRLTDNPEIDGVPRWSPDGSKIAFTSIRGGNMDVYVMDADGGNQIRLTSDLGDDASPAWSPDGQRIAFDSQRDGQWELYVMNSDGSNQTRLTYDMGYYGFPDWSSDGAKLVFLRESAQNYDIYMMDVNRLAFTPLTDQGANEYDPRWSPVSAELANLALYTPASSAQQETNPTSLPDILPTLIPTLQPVSAEPPSVEILAQAQAAFDQGAQIYLFDPQPATVSVDGWQSTQYTVRTLLADGATQVTDALFIKLFNAEGQWDYVVTDTSPLDHWANPVSSISFSTFSITKGMGNPGEWIMQTWIGMTPLYGEVRPYVVERPDYLEIFLVAPGKDEDKLVLNDNTTPLSNSVIIDVTP